VRTHGASRMGCIDVHFTRNVTLLHTFAPSHAISVVP
jgi:hypothetical protein